MSTQGTLACPSHLPRGPERQFRSWQFVSRSLGMRPITRQLTPESTLVISSPTSGYAPVPTSRAATRKTKSASVGRDHATRLASKRVSGSARPRLHRLPISASWAQIPAATKVLRDLPKRSIGTQPLPIAIVSACVSPSNPNGNTPLSVESSRPGTDLSPTSHGTTAIAPT